LKFFFQEKIRNLPCVLPADIPLKRTGGHLLAIISTCLYPTKGKGKMRRMLPFVRFPEWPIFRRIYPWLVTPFFRRIYPWLITPFFTLECCRIINEHF
jgi:hypothetical protein